MRHINYRTHKVPVVAPVGMNKTDPYKTNKQTSKQTNKNIQTQLWQHPELFEFILTQITKSHFK